MPYGLRFKLTDLFVFTLAIALGCAAAQAPDLNWWDGAVVTVCVVVAVIAGRECIAINHARTSAVLLTNDQRFELTFLAWGRFAVVLLLAAALSLEMLHRQRAIELPEGPDFFSE